MWGCHSTMSSPDIRVIGPRPAAELPFALRWTFFHAVPEVGEFTFGDSVGQAGGQRAPTAVTPQP